MEVEAAEETVVVVVVVANNITTGLKLIGRRNVTIVTPLNRFNDLNRNFLFFSLVVSLFRQS